MKLIQNIQSHLEKIYDLQIGEKATDYLISLEEVEELLQVRANHDSPLLPKELFLVNPNPQEDTLEVALFFDDRLTKNLANNSPFESLNSGNISDFCTLIEGVSHFVYYLHKMKLEHNVSQLELELQAEVDKYVLLSFFLRNCGGEILDLLFENYSLYENLNEEQAQRYDKATELARQFCYRLSQLSTTVDQGDLMQELRTFYGLPHMEKIQYILQ